MATITKRSGKYHAQIRKTGYQPLTKTFFSLTTVKRWASTTEADMERSLHVVIPDNTTIRELLGRYKEEVSPTHKSHRVGKYRLQTLRKYLGDKRVSTFSPALICKYRDKRLKAISPSIIKAGTAYLEQCLKHRYQKVGHCYSTKPRVNGFFTQDHKGKR
jgi:hypothetical protein